MVEEKREKTKQQTLSEKKEEGGNARKLHDKGWIHVIQYTIQPTQQWQQHCGAADTHPTQRKTEQFR